MRAPERRLRTILTPLDGSEAAEALLPHLVTLSFGYRAGVLLALAPRPGLDGQVGRSEGAPDAGAAYLGRVAAWLRERGVTTTCAEPAVPTHAALRDLVERLGVDMVALTTRGWGGLGSTAAGGVAELVARTVGCPIVLLRVDAVAARARAEAAARARRRRGRGGARADAVGARPYQRVVVPLDGTPEAERALARVEPLARAFAAEIVVVRATRPPEGDGGRGGPDGLAETELYLGETAERLRQRGVRAGTFSRVGPVDAVILDCARTRGADLIVMVGNDGGGVVEAMVRHAPCPVMVVSGRRG